ncbi:hypothetical protein ACFVW8_04975 [Streptomyces sp. NPDC058221]
MRFADAAAAKGWESLGRQARGNAYRAWITMRTVRDLPWKCPGSTG